MDTTRTIAERAAECEQNFGAKRRMIFGAARHREDFAIEELVFRRRVSLDGDVVRVRVTMVTNAPDHHTVLAWLRCHGPRGDREARRRDIDVDIDKAGPDESAFQ
jgi:hypothetical protein